MDEGRTKEHAYTNKLTNEPKGSGELNKKAKFTKQKK